MCSSPGGNGRKRNALHDQGAGYETLVTHVFRNGNKYLDLDAVFGVRSSLIADLTRHEPGTAPDGTRMEKPCYTLEFEFVLNPAN